MKRFIKTWLLAQSAFMSMALLVFIGNKFLNWAYGNPWGGLFVVFSLLSAFWAAMNIMECQEPEDDE